MEQKSRGPNNEGMPDDWIDSLLNSWGLRGDVKPDHILREITHGPYDEGEPVEDCSCVACQCYREGALPEEVDFVYDWIYTLSDQPPFRRKRLAERIMDIDSLPFLTPEVWAAAAAKVPGAKRASNAGDLPLDEVREVPILRVFRMLGINSFEDIGDEVVTRCPLSGHPDERPSMHVNTSKNVFWCPVCGKGGDGIRLVELVRGGSFPQIVTEIYNECC